VPVPPLRMSTRIDLSGKAAIVTGAGRGLGRAYAVALSAGDLPGAVRGKEHDERCAVLGHADGMRLADLAGQRLARFDSFDERCVDQAIGIGGDKLSLYSHPAEVAAAYHEGGWTPELIAENWSTTMAPKTQPYGITLPELELPTPARS
jgi:hypothetical protein